MTKSKKSEPQPDLVAVRMLYAVRVPKPGGGCREYTAGGEFFVAVDVALEWVDRGAAEFVDETMGDAINYLPAYPVEPNPFEEASPEIPAARDLED